MLPYFRRQAKRRKRKNCSQVRITSEDICKKFRLSVFALYYGLYELTFRTLAFSNFSKVKSFFRYETKNCLKLESKKEREINVALRAELTILRAESEAKGICRQDSLPILTISAVPISPLPDAEIETSPPVAKRMR